MASIYTNLEGEDLDAFHRFLQTESLRPSAGLLRIFREWRRLVASVGPLPRYSTLGPAQLNLILGEAAEIKRALKHCELALLEPRPMTQEDLAAWQIQQDAVQDTLQRISAWQDGLIRTEMVITTPPVDLVVAQRLANVAYRWTGTAEKYRELLFGLLQHFVKIPPPPSIQPAATERLKGTPCSVPSSAQ
jgi:hypothetical protein